MNDILKACEYLKNNDNFLILMHESPDGDTVGSASALCRALRLIGKSADYDCCDIIPSKYSYMVDGLGKMSNTAEHIIAVDVADAKLLGTLEQVYGEKVELCIDHHGSNTGYAQFTVVRPDAAAACEVIYEVIKALGCDITREIADCLYTGIATDTGCFKFSNVTPTTHRITAELMSIGINAAEINRIMFDTMTFARIKAERMALDSMDILFDGKCAITVITAEMQAIAPNDDLEGIKTLTRQIEGVVIGITLREKGPDDYKISVRTHPSIDASAICGKFGGGGHVCAAGCEIKMPIDKAKEAIISAVGEVAGL